MILGGSLFRRLALSANADGAGRYFPDRTESSFGPVSAGAKRCLAGARAVADADARFPRPELPKKEVPGA